MHERDGREGQGRGQHLYGIQEGCAVVVNENRQRDESRIKTTWRATSHEHHDRIARGRGSGAGEEEEGQRKRHPEA